MRRAPEIWLFHGLGDDGTSWSAMLQTDVLAGLDVARIEIPGHGRARRVEARHLEATAYTIGRRVAKGRRPIVLVGHSLGGALATLIAAGGWPFVVGLVNIEGNLTPADCTLSADASRAADVGFWIEETRRRMARTQPRYAAALGRATPDAVGLAAKDLVRLSTGASIGRRFAALGLPKLYVGGAGVPEETMQFLVGNRVERTLIPGAGHWVMEDRPAETAIAIERFVSGLDDEP